MKFFLLCVLPALFAPIPAFGQASVGVSTLDPVYRDIEKLVAHGLIDVVIWGQRPFSRLEIARMTGDARGNLSGLEKRIVVASTSDRGRAAATRLAYLTSIVESLEVTYHRELVQLGLAEPREGSIFRPIESVEIGYLFADTPSRGVPFNGVGLIDIEINPLVQYREGRRVVDGNNVFLETYHQFQASKHVALAFRPRVQLAYARGQQPNINGAFVQELYGTISFKNIEIQIGRSNLFFGQGTHSGMLLSNNPRGLDMVRISNVRPFVMPWIFGFLGANKITFFLSDLGPEQNFPHPYLAGYKWSIQPTRFLELGASIVVEGGGEGSPSGSFGDRVLDLFPIGRVLAIRNISISNKQGGVDGRLRITSAGGLELYAEAIFNDSRSAFSSPRGLFIDEGGYVFGIHFPRLVDMGRGDLRVEYRRTGPDYYTHGQFITGWTLEQLALGDNLGPDAKGTYVTSRWDIGRRNRLSLRAAIELRRNDRYRAVEPARHFIKIQDNPDESRLRFVASWYHLVPQRRLEFEARAGFERTQNWSFAEGSTRNNLLVEILMKFIIPD